MASTQSFTEWNGAGQTATTARPEMNLKNIDDSSSAYSSYPVTAGNNSFGKYQAIVFAGSWNSLSAMTVKIGSNSPVTGVSIVGAIVTSYSTPSTAATGDSAMSTTGINVNFVSSSSAFGTGSSSASGGGTFYGQCLRLQMQTTSGAGPGDFGQQTLTYSWTES